MKRPLLGKNKDHIHRLKITLSSKNVKDLERVCANLVSGSKSKTLQIEEDDESPLKALPISSMGSLDRDGTDYPPLRNGRSSKKGCTNFRWSPAMTRFLLPFLVEQAKSGNKVNKSFKRPALLAAARAVSEKFHLMCTASNVENHLRTVKTHYTQIKKLQGLSNTIWDEKDRKIIMDVAAYSQHIMLNPKDEPFLNKRIDMYDEIVLVCGDEQVIRHEATPTHGITEHIEESLLPTSGEGLNIMMSDDIEIDEEGDANETESKSQQVSLPSESTGTGRIGQSDKSRHYLADKIDHLAMQIGQLAEAIKCMQRDIASELFTEVMKADGYDEILLGKAFDYLQANENLGRAFLAKNYNLRQAWLADFFSSSGLV